MESPTFKKRTKPSATTSSLRNPIASTSTLVDSESDSKQLNSNGGNPDEEEGSAVIFRTRVKKTPSGRVKELSKPKIKSRLSFGATGDEEEEESFVIKKSIPSTSTASISSTPRRLLRATAASLDEPTIPVASPLASSSTNQNSSTPRSIYSKEYLQELSQATASTPPRGTINDEGEMNDRVEFDELTKSQFGSSDGYRLAMDEDGEETIAQMIPTSASIAEAKSRRERMRKEGGGTGSGSSSSGFISLEVGAVNKRSTGKSESRLVREDDELDEEDDVMLPLGKKANALAAKNLKSSMAELLNDAQEENEQDSLMANGDEDDEGREWEEAQIKRGEGRTYVQEITEKKAYRPAAIPTTSALPSLTSLTSRLSLRLNNLVTSHSVDSAALEHFEKERKELADQETELRADVEGTNRKRAWYGEIRSWGEEMGSFLETKFPQLESVETTSLAILKEVLSITSRQRYAEETDDLTLLSGESLSTFFVPILAINVPSSVPMAELEAPFAPTRVARREARESRSSPAWTLLSTNQLLDLQSAKSDLHDSLFALFSDVKSAEFRDPFAVIKKYFTEWKLRYGEEYENAFASLGVVGCAEFWVRLELISWIGLEVKPNQSKFQFTDFAWFNSLNNFSSASSSDLIEMTTEMKEDNEEEAERSSHELLSNIIETVFIPRLILIIRESFDPFNEMMNTRLVEMVEEVGLYVEKSSARFQNLIHEILLSIHSTILQTQVLLSFPNSISSNPLRHSHSSLLPNPAEFYALRNSLLGRLLILLKNSLKWRGKSGGRSNRWKFPSSNVELEFIEESNWESVILNELITTILPMLEGEAEIGGWGGSGGGKLILEDIMASLRGCELSKQLTERLQNIG